MQAKSLQRPEPPCVRCLIVEASLIQNRGHHHTQVAALASLLPRHEISLLAGPHYNFFLPYAARLMASDVQRLEYLTRRAAHGSLRQKLTSRADILLSGKIWPFPRSGYGTDLAAAVLDFGMGPEDLIAIPSATIGDLAAAVDAAGRLGRDRFPYVQMRFLDPLLGEPTEILRNRRMKGLLRELPSSIDLACETEELARWFSDQFGYPFKGGVYLPCTVDPRSEAVSEPQRQGGGLFRVGVFGAPKKRKGSARIASIISALAERDVDVEMLIQGEAGDFEPGGIFYLEDPSVAKRVRVVPMLGELTPDAFRSALLSVDAILLPYDTSVYGLQGSGLVQDAVAALRPIIHSRGLSMRCFLQHGNAIDALTDQDFADAIVRLTRFPNGVSDGCRKAREVFRFRLVHPVLFGGARP